MIPCGRCGRRIPRGGASWDARLQITHAADPLVVTDEELKRDHGSEIRDLLDEMASRDPRELEEEVHLERSLRLCSACRLEVLRAFVRRPSHRRRRQPRRRRPRQ